MIKLGILVGALALVVAACSPAPILTSGPIPTLPPLPSLVPPATAIITSAASATPVNLSPSATASPTLPSSAITGTVTARSSVTATINLTPTRAPATAAPAASPTSAVAGLPPGVYVTDIKVEPNPPTRSSDLIFSPTFVNATSAIQNYQWKVYIYKTDTPSRSTGETPLAQTAVPVGVSDQRAGGTWKYGPGNQCDFFFVRVGSLDQDKKIILFLKPDGKVFEKNLTLCP
jgi:hypothetical protein